MFATVMWPLLASSAAFQAPSRGVIVVGNFRLREEREPFRRAMR